VLRKLVDALNDGVMLADGDGAIVLANRRLAEIFGYQRADLLGRPVEPLLPVELRSAHRGQRAAYGRAPGSRPMGAGARLVGLRRDGATFPAEISLSPVATATQHLALAVVRDVTDMQRLEDLADLARAAVAAEQAHHEQQLLDRITGSLYEVGLSLQAAAELPHELASERIAGALRLLDDTIREIRDTAFSLRSVSANAQREVDVRPAVWPCPPPRIRSGRRR
jgi:PAS domain S-box-containing protein